MQPEKVINVREVLQQNSYTTTVDELRNRGKSKVRVINAEQISQLIEEAVNRVVSTSGGMGREEVKKLVDRSREEFKRLLAEREKELNEHRERLRLLDQAREDLTKSTAEIERLRVVESELRKQAESSSGQVAELKATAKVAGLSEADRAEMERLRRAENEALREKEGVSAQLAEARRAEAQARAEKEALLVQMGELKQAAAAMQAQPAAAPAPAPTASPEMMEMLKTLASELGSVKAGLKEVATRPAETGAGGTADKAVADKMAEFSKDLAERLDRIGKKVGISSGSEAGEVVLDNIFNNQETLESNMENVEVKERRGSGIGGALERIKNLRNKKKAD